MVFVFYHYPSPFPLSAILCDKQFAVSRTLEYKSDAWGNLVYDAMASYDKSGYDVEYNAHPSSDEKHRSVVAPDESGAVHGESFAAGDTLYAKLQRLAGRFGVEQRGIERVPDDERTDKTVIKLSTMVCFSIRFFWRRR